MKTAFEFISLFAGMGAGTFGALRAGGKCLLAVDFNATALKTHRANMPSVPAARLDLAGATVSDIRALVRRFGRNPDKWRGVFLVTAPCQAFATCGRMDAEDPRAKLILIIIAIMRACPLAWIIAENVEGITFKGKHGGFKFYQTKQIVDAIREYRGIELDRKKLREYMLFARDLGLPQRRLRLVLPIPPKGKKMPPPLRPRCKVRTFREALKGFRDPYPGAKILTIPERKIYRYILAAENLSDAVRRLGPKAPKALRAYDKKIGPKKCRRIGWGEPTHTITTVSDSFMRTSLVHPTKARHLSVGECMICQGIPLDWIIHGGMFQMYEQVGNAMPPIMAEAAIRAYVLGEYPENKRIGTVLLYPGSKMNLSNRIVETLHSEISDQRCYWEPFIGGGAVAMEIARRFPQARLYLNDADPDIYSYWKIVAAGSKQQRDELCRLLKQKATRRKCETYKRKKPISMPERAFKAILLNRCSFNNYVGGGFVESRIRSWPADLPQRLREQIELFEGRTTVTNLHIRDVLKDAPQAAPIYLDPPYLERGRKYYGQAMTEAEHEEMARLLSKRDNWLLSYGDEKIIRSMYSERKIEAIEKGFKRGDDLLISA